MVKVSDRIIRLRIILENNDLNALDRIIIVWGKMMQLEAEIAEALQIAREEGHDAGYNLGVNVGYQDGYKEGLHICNLPNKGQGDKMKVSERIQEIRQSLNDDVGILALRTALNSQLTQLEVKIAESLQIARQGGYQASSHDGFNRRQGG